MITLSTRAKEAIKTSLAITIAMGIALWVDWEKPYWAGFTEAFISLPMEGQCQSSTPDPDQVTGPIGRLTSPMTTGADSREKSRLLRQEKVRARRNEQGEAGTT